MKVMSFLPSAHTVLEGIVIAYIVRLSVHLNDVTVISKGIACSFKFISLMHLKMDQVPLENQCSVIICVFFTNS